MVQIHNEDCFVTMERMNPHSVDVVLTSPFYNTNKKAGKTRTLKNTKVADGQYDYVRYDTFYVLRLQNRSERKRGGQEVMRIYIYDFE